ncbi:MAG: hypothetical protein IJP62_05305 [Treponema sp.]|nr:hypothetical protein [Bacteroidaceae bacterium]MBQ6780633.1 hypothetical protein [Treponema sp.]
MSESFEVKADVAVNVNKDGSGKKDSGNTFLFTGELKASYGSDYKETGSEEYGIYSYNSQLGSYKIDTSEMIDNAVDENPDGSFTNNYLTDGAYKAIYGLTSAYKGEAGIKKLLDTYGTHVIVSGIMGGRRDYSMRIKTSKIDDDFVIEGYLKAGYKNKFGDTDDKAEEAYDVNLEADVVARYEEKMKEDSTFYTSSINSVGGAPRLVLSEKDWIGTLTDDNAALMSFQSNSLVPIWDLCLDEERAKAIENAAIAYAKEQSNDFFNLIGRIVLKDGSVVPSSTYTANSSNPAVGVIAYLGTGGDLGRKDTAYMIGLKQYTGMSGYIFDKNILLFTKSDSDGTQNFRKLLDEAKGIKWENVDWDASHKYLRYMLNDTWYSVTDADFAGIYYTYCYGKLNCAGSSYEDGWFVPSINELTAILKNYESINKGLKYIPNSDSITTSNYWSSTYSSIKTYCSKIGLSGTPTLEYPNWKYNFCFVYPIPIANVYANIKN